MSTDAKGKVWAVLPHLGRGACFVYLVKNLEWFTVKPSACSCPLHSMHFMLKLQIHQCWMNMFASLQKDWRGEKNCMQQASPWLGTNFCFSWFQEENTPFPAWWACPIPAGFGAGWCMWTQLQLECCWLTALVMICKECPAAGDCAVLPLEISLWMSWGCTRRGGSRVISD